MNSYSTSFAKRHTISMLGERNNDFVWLDKMLLLLQLLLLLLLWIRDRQIGVWDYTYGLDMKSEKQENESAVLPPNRTTIITTILVSLLLFLRQYLRLYTLHYK